MAAPRLNSRVANVFLRLCEETLVMRALRSAARPEFAKINLRLLRFGEHLRLRKRVFESFQFKDTITVIYSEGYGTDVEPKDSVGQDTPSKGHRHVLSRHG